MEYDDFFKTSFGIDTDVDFRPYDYQSRLATEPWPSFLDIPTGMGKTAAVVLAWLWKRRVQHDPDTPKRLVYCLPMRVLVEQTVDNINNWLDALDLAGVPGQGRVSTHILMGGETDLKSWAEYPQEDVILVGTQDMLLSRALMRGYGMSRYQWPIHFALLHNDALWVYDEIQLMGAGLPTSAQLEAFRREFPIARGSRSLWVSATLNRDWLATVDMRSYLPQEPVLGLSDNDRDQADERLTARKALEMAPISISKACSNQKGLKEYIDLLADLVVNNHAPAAQTLVIVNRVDRAQALFERLRKTRQNETDLLVHGRFRPFERSAQARNLRASEPDRIIVATQAIEAGVDISAQLLITELAPWTSMVQRFGRCNRYGEHNMDGAKILWIGVDGDAEPSPYTPEELEPAREKLQGLCSASATDLPPTDEDQPLSTVIRRKDFLELFNTDPDLSGFDVDVSDYIRDTDSPGVRIFWRDFDENPNTPELIGQPTHHELCPVSIGQAKAYRSRKDVDLWSWDFLSRKWIPFRRDPRPGMTLLCHANCGGYDASLGFKPQLKPPVKALPGETDPIESFADDWRSVQPKPVLLPDHLANVARHAELLCASLDETESLQPLVRAGRWHDLGKAHPVFHATMHACPDAPAGLLAKSPCRARHERPYFRHELASMLAWLEQHDEEDDADLIAYLILAHHGKVRMSLRAIPGETARNGVKRFARGVWEDDTVPALEFDGERSEEIRIRLEIMELGLGEQGPSWTERALNLLDQYGPFRLAWLETLVRLADWRASAEEQE